MKARSAELAGARVLVVEDEYLIADDLSRALAEQGATVVGPAPSFADAAKLIAQESVDAAVLDINLNGEMAYPLADILAGAGIPFVVASGYGQAALAKQLAAAAYVEKPCTTGRLTALLADVLHASDRFSH